MPLGKNNTDLNETGITYKDGFPVTWPTPNPSHFGNEVDWLPSPDYFGNEIPSSGTNENTVDWQPSPEHFGNKFGPVTPPSSIKVVQFVTNQASGGNTGQVVLNAPKAGNTLVFGFFTFVDQDAQSVTRVTDSLISPTKYTTAPGTEHSSSLTGAGCTQGIYYYPNTAGSAGTVTISIELAAVCTTLYMWAYEVSGLSAIGNVVDSGVALATNVATINGDADGSFFFANPAVEVGGTVSAVNSPWVIDAIDVVGGAEVHLIAAGSQVLTVTNSQGEGADNSGYINYVALS